MGQLTADDVVARVRDLPAFPAVVTQVLKATRDPDTSAVGVANILATDQALTAKVLRLANSALFGFPRRVSTLTDAVVLLGFSTLRGLVLAGTAFGMLNRRVDGYSLDKGVLWQHSLGTALACRSLCQRARRRALADEAFVAGVLHDLGKVVLDSYVGEAFSQIIEIVTEQHRPFMEAERQVLGFDHAEVGARVAEAWSLPVELCEAIRFHHEPANAPPENLLPQAAHLGDIVALSLGIGVGGDGLNYPMDGGALVALGLAPEDVEAVMTELPDIMVDESAWQDLDR